MEIHEQLEDFIQKNKGAFVSDRVRIYSFDELQEMNDIYQTQEFCPGFITFGDDSGGRAVVCADSFIGKIFIVDHGSMVPQDFEELAHSFKEWQVMGFRLNT